MTVRIIDDAPKPGTDAWRQLVTASKVPAILGLSPWQSPYSLWHEMAGNIEPEPPDEKRQAIFDWGHAAEQGIAAWWSLRNPDWEVSDGEVAITDDALPFPNLVTVDRLATHRETGAQRILEFKTVNSFDALGKWGKPGTPDSAPANYLSQHYFQRGVSQIHDGEIVVQAMGAPETHAVTWDPVTWANMLTRITRFYRSLEAGTPPDLDGSTVTYDTVRGLHPDIDRDTIYAATAEEALALLRAKKAEEEAIEHYRGLKSELLAKMGNKHRAVAGDTVFARRQPGRGPRPEFRLVAKAREELENEHAAQV